METKEHTVDFGNQKEALFLPTNKDLRIEYPELSDIEEFQDLNSREMVFCWYMGNRTSPYFNYKDQRKKRIYSTKASFTSGMLPPAEEERYHSGNFKEKIREGIERMTRFNPLARTRAKLYTNVIFDKIQTIINIDDEELATLDDKKDYIGLVKTVTEIMPKLVDQVEQSYGIKSILKKSGSGKQPTLMDIIHNESDLKV